MQDKSNNFKVLYHDDLVKWPSKRLNKELNRGVLHIGQLVVLNDIDFRIVKINPTTILLKTQGTTQNISNVGRKYNIAGIYFKSIRIKPKTVLLKSIPIPKTER